MMMMPILINIGPLKIYSMGFFLVLGLLLGMFVAWKKSLEYHIETRRFFDIQFGLLLYGLIGARIGYILLNFSDFGLNIAKWLWFTYYVGLSVFGLFIAVVVYLFIELDKKNEDIFKWLDLISLQLSFGGVLVFIGMWLDGVKLYQLFNLTVYPILIVLMFAIFKSLWFFEKHYRKFDWYRGSRVDAKSGFLWFSFLIGFGVISASIGLGVKDMIDLGISILLLLIGVVGLFIRSGHKFKK